MASPLSQTGQDIQAAIVLRLNELGHNLSPSHIAALVADIIAVCVADNANVAAHTVTDGASYKPPAHIKF